MTGDTKKKLVIIESPAKAKSLKNYLGRGWDVVASYGHVRDLPLNRLGVNTETLEPVYTILPSKRAAVAKLRKTASAYSEIYLAADPDREGEAICWHIYKLLQGKGISFRRIRFNSITREAVRAASRTASDIDMNLVDAQQARRVMDRLVGYKISPYLWRTVGKGLSAGRVQTVALRLIAERELAIRSFVPREFWPVTAEFRQNGSVFQTKLYKIDGKRADGDRHSPGSRETADRVLSQTRGEALWKISSLVEKNKARKPVPPFITSSLQVAASARLSMPPSVTMRLAQDLYEGFEINGETTGLITYMRTDSVRIEPAAIADCRSFVEQKWSTRELSPKPRRYRASGGAQDAHEAIRPTDVRRTPEEMAGILDDRHLKLYSLVWKRFVATQMADAIVAETEVLVSSGELVFRATGQKVVSRGFSLVDPAQLKIVGKIPELAEGVVEFLDVTAEQKFTKPLSRYSEAALVSEMKKKAIGRPSTYVSIISTLKKRTYVEAREKKLFPTEVGMVTADLLVKLFPHLFDVGFTATLEELLDLVASGKTSYKEAVKQLYTPLAASLEEAMRRLPEIKASMVKETAEKCPLCGKVLLEKMGKYGKFLACSGFPSCRYTRPVNEDSSSTVSDVKCAKCGKDMLLRNGRYGRYLACSDPACGHTQPVPVGVKCPVPDCTGELVERRSRRGKVFYSCSRYPDCDYAMWNKPVARECPRCGFPLLEERKKGVFCPRCKKKID
ncbi:type I DNA topoisomerase [Candidatus Fermentibacteria bacterium]|nr:MAG: type I DNA topoisomerase [Candidatus Fermentibacteria bacterium]